jgi:hypothetical protein
MPAIIREFNTKDKSILHNHYIKEEYCDAIKNKLECRRLSIPFPLSANKLDEEVRQKIATRLLDWLLYECNYIIKEEREYDEEVSKRSNWRSRCRKKE